MPVYADATLEPYSLIYVPVGGSAMREYERRRERELASTTGSRAPTFPVAIATEGAPREPEAGASVAAAVGTTGVRISTPATSDRLETSVPVSVGASGGPDPARPHRTSIESIPRPSGANGVWLEFNGTRWYADGAATIFTPSRFAPIGDYRGFPVYRDKTSMKDGIWVSVVKDGPVAQYTRR